jgi:FkbM family methyltransferase
MSAIKRSLVTARNMAWRQLPALGRAEVSYRRSKLLERLWDLRFLSDLPGSDATALDIGANIGVYTSVLASRFARVEAFEPNPALARRLSLACPSNVTVWPVAASDAQRVAELHVPIIGGSTVGGLGSLEPLDEAEAVQTTTVQSIALDALDLHDVSLLKIDVEGHEAATLDGASSLLNSPTLRTVLVEAEERHVAGATARLFARMSTHGFDGFFAHGPALHSVDGFDPTVHQIPTNIVNPTAYSNVFLFLRPGDESTRRLAGEAAALVASR